MKKIIILLAALFPLYSFACSDINLYDERPEILDIGIVNQGDMATCYAHSMATLYNMELTSHESERAHPYWVAYNHKKRLIHWNPRNLNYSILSWAYNDLKKRGNCSYQATENRLHELKNGVAYSNDQLMFLLHAFFKEKKGEDLNDNASFLSAVDKTLARVQKKSQDFELEWKKPQLVKVLSPIRNAAQEGGFYRFLGNHVFNHCSSDINQEVSEKLTYFARGFGSNKKIAKRLEDVLADGKSVAVGYCARTTYKDDPATSRDVNRFPRIARAISTRCGSHYSMLLGSRRAGNSCQYLLRNTYGEGFWAHEAFECYCQDRSSGQNRNCRKSESSNPNLKVLGCWIDRDKLLSNTFDLSYF